MLRFQQSRHSSRSLRPSSLSASDTPVVAAEFEVPGIHFRNPIHQDGIHLFNLDLLWRRVQMCQRLWCHPKVLAKLHPIRFDRLVVVDSIYEQGSIRGTNEPIGGMKVDHEIQPLRIRPNPVPPCRECRAIVDFRVVVSRVDRLTPEIAVSRNEPGERMANEGKFVERFKLFGKFSLESICGSVATNLLSRYFAKRTFDCRARGLRDVDKNCFQMRVDLWMRIDHSASGSQASKSGLCHVAART